MNREEKSRYYASREWALLRERVRERSGGFCEVCWLRDMEQTHHLTYERMGNENLEDLQAICDPCHRYVSGKDKTEPAKLVPNWAFAMYLAEQHNKGPSEYKKALHNFDIVIVEVLDDTSDFPVYAQLFIAGRCVEASIPVMVVWHDTGTEISRRTIKHFVPMLSSSRVIFNHLNTADDDFDLLVHIKQKLLNSREVLSACAWRRRTIQPTSRPVFSARARARLKL